MLKQCHREMIIATLPKPPKDKNTVTPTEIINSGLYTEDQLLEAIEELIVNGRSFRSIANEYKISLSQLSRWLSHPQRIARTMMATKISADYYADKSIEVLKSCPLDKVSVMLADKQSQAYRWMARVRDVSKYGEKLDVTSDNKPIVQVNLGAGIAPPLEVIEGDNYIEIESS